MEQLGDPARRRDGLLLSTWLFQVANELPYDAVGLWQIDPGLRYDFDLTGSMLEQGMRAAVRTLLAAGAVPVQGAKDPERWVIRADLVAPGEAGIDLAVRYWLGLGREPDVGDLWFALPSEVA